jgi:hypothetical protein
MDLRVGQAWEEMSAMLKGTRKLAPAAAGRWSLKAKIRKIGRRRHRADTCAGTETGAQAVGTVPPAPHWDVRLEPGLVSFATAPLHSIPATKARFHSIAFRRSQTAETGTDSGAMKVNAAELGGAHWNPWMSVWLSSWRGFSVIGCR